MKNIRVLAALLLAASSASRALAQENYEIQVYPSETADKGKTLFELHSNFTGMGTRFRSGFLLPTNDAVHETLEITHGFSDNFELGFYLFSSVTQGSGWQFVGSHIRPRVRVPESWKWPVGVSLSTEFGPTDKKFDESEFGVELRPIVDQTVGKLYWSLNPTVGWSMKGPEAGKGIHGMMFEPSLKLGWQFNPKIQAGVEYYGTTGSLTRMAPSRDQSHVLYPSIDLFLDPEWEFNAGFGFLVSGTGDQHILKVILGRRFPW
ncbi:MAG: hypothetical protein ACHQQ3_07385 [Gemmatimonadales bacterium]